ncbi:hypothetical protein MCAMS1_00893 [biofilm metagenome]
MSNNFLQYLSGSSGETWQQALGRFALFCKNLHEIEVDGKVYEAFLDEYYEDGTLFEKLDATQDSDLAAAEASFNFSMPDELKKLFQDRFAIYDTSIKFGRWGERTLLIINKAWWENTFCLRPFCEAIAWNFGPYFADSELSGSQIRLLNQGYFCFGDWSDDDHSRSYLLVDRHGQYGHYDFHTEDYPGSLERPTPLLNGNKFNKTLDQVLVWAIDKSISYLLDRNEIPCE